MKLALTIAGILISIIASSQNIATASLQWTSSTTFAAHDGSTARETTIVSTSPGHLVWTSEVGTVIQDLSLSEQSAAWTNVANQGAAAFEVQAGNVKGSVLFQKHSGETIIRLSLLIGEDLEVYELSITQIETIQ